MRTLVVYCHPDPESFTAAIARPCRRGAARARRRGARHRPLRRRLRSRVQRRGARPPPRTGARPGGGRPRRRPAVVRAARARLPDVVERPAGDAQGLDRPGVGPRRRLRPARRSRTACTPGCATCAGSSPSRRTARRSWSTRWRARSASARSRRTLRAVCHPLARTTWIAMYGVDTVDGRRAPRLPRPRRAEAAMNDGAARTAAGRAGGGRVRARRRRRRWTRSCSPSSTTRCDPRVHERRVPSVGAIVEPTTPVEQWESGTQLVVTRRPVEAMPLTGARLFADGLVELDHPARRRRRRVGGVRPAGRLRA